MHTTVRSWKLVWTWGECLCDSHTTVISVSFHLTVLPCWGVRVRLVSSEDNIWRWLWQVFYTSEFPSCHPAISVCWREPKAAKYLLQPGKNHTGSHPLFITDCWERTLHALCQNPDTSCSWTSDKSQRVPRRPSCWITQLQMLTAKVVLLLLQ